jgi:peptide/nickel transport system substrate-binding protein
MATPQHPRRRRSRRSLIAVLVLFIIAVACAPTGTTGTTGAPSAPGQAKTGGTLRIGTSTDVLSMDMANYRGGQDWLVGSLVFDTLVAWNPDGTPRPSLAESWKQVDDKTYQITLRKGVKFTDGTPFNADAVKKGFERAGKTPFGKIFLFMIDSVSADNESTVTFKLNAPYSAFINNLAIMVDGIPSPTAVDKFGDQFVRNPVGTGPFKLTEWVAGQQMTFERNPDYWGTKPKLDKIVVKFIADESTRLAALDAGELDVIQNAPAQAAKDLKASSKNQLIAGAYSQTLWFGFNHSNPILAKKDVRQALSMAVDANGLVQNVTEGVTRVANGFFPPEVVKTQITPPAKGDVAKAKALLAQAGYPNGFSIELWVPTGRYIRDKEIAQAIQQPLKAIGVDATIKALDYAAYSTGMGRREAGIFVLAWAFTSNPDTMLRSAFYSKTTATNWSAYNNPAIDKLVDSAVVQSKYEDAVKIWQQADQMLVDDYAGVPIYWSSNLFGASKKVHDFVQTPLGLFDLNATWIE